MSGLIRTPEGVIPVIQTVKLSKLHLSALNVRKSNALNIDEIAADIEARGVLQNLLVTPMAKPRGHFAVFDGRRRLTGLNLLAERGVIDPETYDVPVMVLKGDDATLSETSLAANFHQLKMGPAEECRAFQHFLGLTGNIDGVAKRFGLTRRFIEGRLRLASLAEPIFDALNHGEITLDLAKAYASTENQEKQLLIWNSYGQSYSEDTIRRAIANESMKANDPVALLVGEDRYAQAGGRVDRDLFSDGGDRWINPEIAQRLASDLMEEEAKRVGEELGLAWIRPVASAYTYNAAAGLYRVQLPQPELTQEQSVRLAEIEARHEVLHGEMEDDELSEEAYQALDREYDELAEEAQAIHRRAPYLPDELKSHVGLFLTLSTQGVMQLDTDYYSEQPIRIEQPEGDEDGEGSNGEGSRFTIGDRGSDRPKADPAPETVGPGGKPLSAKLYDELAMQRRDILAACLLAHPALALDYALFAMVDDRTSHLSDYGTTVRAHRPQDPVFGEVPTTRAREYLAEAQDGLDASWTEHKSEVDRFEAFRALDDDTKASWLAYIVAMSLEAKRPGYASAQNKLQNRIASIIEVDVAAWWRPTSENFFDRVNKGTILTLLGEIGGETLTARHATLKKTDISQSCHKLFAGESIVEADVKEAALAWVPNAMRFLDVPAGEIEEIEGTQDDQEEMISAEDDRGETRDIDLDEAEEADASDPDAVAA